MDSQIVQTSASIVKDRNNDMKLRLTKIYEKLNTWKYTHRSSLYLLYIFQALHLFKRNLEELFWKQKTTEKQKNLFL